MSERSTDDVRKEIAAERERLNDDVARLRSEVRSLALFVGAGLAVVALVTWRVGRRKGAETIWKLVR